MQKNNNKKATQAVFTVSDVGDTKAMRSDWRKRKSVFLLSSSCNVS